MLKKLFSVVIEFFNSMDEDEEILNYRPAKKIKGMHHLPDFLDADGEIA